ncbi:MAG: M16 family metallopeptidase [Deinococcales bacterium]
MVQHTRLENGLALLLEPVPSSALVCFELLVPLGSVNEPIAGCSSVQEEWLGRGAAGKSAKEIEDAWDERGILRSSEVGLESLELSVTCLAQDADYALGLLADWVLRPNFCTQDFPPALELAKAALESLEDTPDEILVQRLWDSAFQSPHRRSPYGNREGFAALQPEQVRQDYFRRATPQGSILAASGALRWEDFFRLAQTRFRAWRGKAPELHEVVWNPARSVFEPRDTAQTQIGMIMPIMPYMAEGYFASRFALEVLGGGNSSRLFYEVREKRGLVYGIHASNSFMRGAGTLDIFASCTPSHTRETLHVIYSELERWKAGISQAEFERAKVCIESNLALSSESVGARAAALMRDQHLLERARSQSEVEQGLAHIRLDDVNAWLAALDLNRLHTCVLGVEVAL